MRSLTAFTAGGLFGAGLWVSGMTDTRKVIGWLDFFGNWDPTLAFVISGAIAPMFIAWRIAAIRGVPVLGGLFPEPPEARLDPSLIIGSLMFGAGWGLAGLCPGPAIASITWGGLQGILFLAAMAIGMAMAPRIRGGIENQPKAASSST
ncbi:MAG: DUF6691 family protein [Boseongicola sp.]